MSPQTDQVITFTAEQQAELLEQPRDDRPLEADELAGPTLVSLISPGTEIGQSYLGRKFPAEPGYAAVFRVEEVGSGVEDVGPGDVALCTGPGSVGGHRSHQRCPRKTVLPLPEGLSPEVAVHARLMGVSMTTLTTTTARPPEKVLVLGLGPVGHFAAQNFAACGYEVMAVEPIETRRRLAAEKGIEAVYPALPTDDKSALAGIALALECSGHEQAVYDACCAVRKRGEVVVVGVPRRRKSDLYAFDVLQKVFRRYVVLRSGWEWEISRYGEDFRTGSVYGNLAAAMRWLADRRVRVDGLYRKGPPAEAQQAYQDLLHRNIDELSVVFDWAGSA